MSGGLPGSHIFVAFHSRRLFSLVAGMLASRQSYFCSTIRSIVAGPTSMPLPRCPCHFRLPLSTYRMFVPLCRFVVVGKYLPRCVPFRFPLFWLSGVGGGLLV